MESKYNQVIKSLQPFLNKQNLYNNFGKKIGNAQRHKREMTLKQGFKYLRDSKYKIKNVKIFKERHFVFLFNIWIEQGLSASAIQYRSSVFRVFANNWLSMPGMIKSTKFYSKDDPLRIKRCIAATESKCWTDNAVNPKNMIAMVAQYDKRVAMQLELQLLFMLRKKESFLLKPKIADCGELLLVKWGTKGGRDRIVLIDSPQKLDVIRRAQKMTDDLNGSMIPKNKSLVQWQNRYSYVLRKFGITKKDLGITSHGLRHEAANNLYEEICGQKSEVQGGEVTSANIDKARLARDIVSLSAGHSRRSITSAYLGAQKLKKPIK